jgi:hypothetical protein
MSDLLERHFIYISKSMTKMKKFTESGKVAKFHEI